MGVRTEIPSALVTTPTSAPSQPPAELRGSAGKQQHGAGEQCPGREKGERVGCGRRTGHMPHLSPTERAHPRSHTPDHSSGTPSSGRGPLLPPTPWAARNRAGAAQPAKTTASATDPAVPARCYSCPTASCPPQNTHQLQRYGVTGANSYPFPISQALAHQHHHQPRRRTRAACTPISPTRMHEFLDNWCKFFYLIMGILSYCTGHHVYVQIALTEVHSRS